MHSVEKMLLSLKNIYKMLMNNDFPIYSDSVIAEKNRKGQTLLRFWQSILAEEFRSLSNGRMIWRNDGKRNRYLSNLCNRSMDLKRYREYSRELVLQLNETTLLNQISRFEKFLAAREYRHDILLRRIMEMTRLWEAEDSHASPSILQQIRTYAVPCDSLERYGTQGKLFQSGYVLSLLTLYAAAGDAMDDPSMTVLREERFGMAALWEARQKLAEEKETQLVFLTNHVGMIQDNPLPQHRFFGREEELYDLQEMALARRKCLISGIGGIGKTELVRQLLRLNAAENTIDKIAVIPYETGLAESFYRAFPTDHLQRPEDSFRRILLTLQQDAQSGQNILLIIDDLNKGLEEDPDLSRLLELSCGVLITTRRSHLEGFETYRLNPPSVTTGALIFRDNYGQPLTRTDRELLKEMLLAESLCHPLTLHLMARAAQSRGWSVAQMKEHLQQEGISLTWMENERSLRVTQMYNQLYSFQQIPMECRHIAELFTLMPSGSYSEEFLRATFPEILGEKPEEKLLQLLSGGWLDAGASGYYMHPLIAECLRRKVLTEEKLQAVLSCLQRWLPRLQLLETELERNDAEAQRIAHILLYMAEFLTGSISRSLMVDILNAANTLLLTQSSKEALYKKLKAWWKRCREQDTLTELIYCIVLSNWNLSDPEQNRMLYRKQKESLSVPRSLFLDFCLSVGSELSSKAQLEEAVELLQEALAKDASPSQQAMAYYHISGCYQVAGKAELALQWSEQGVKYVTEHPECGSLAYFNNLFSLCTQSLTFRKQEQARKLLDHIEKMLDGNPAPDMNMQLYSLLGLYEMIYGDQEQALAYVQKQLQLNQEYFGKDRNHYSLLGTIGDILSKLGRFEEAAAHYDECLAYARSSGNRKMLLFKSNNGAVLYLRMHNPHKALELLETALAEARITGGLMLGEALRNTALAYGQLNDSAREYASLREAMPLLLEAYGPEHERVTAARERLEKLTKEFT